LTVEIEKVAARALVFRPILKVYLVHALINGLGFFWGYEVDNTLGGAVFGVVT
jgi:hypothetical protein